MPVGYKPQPIEEFGGLNTLIEASNLPPFMSPDSADVEYVPGLVKTRLGTIQQFAVNGTVNYNYLKTYITPLQLLRMLTMDSTGQLWVEINTGILTPLSATLALNALANSTSLFGREYIGISDGQFGVSMPRQFDNSTVERVSQGGPGAAPSVTDENSSVGIAASGGIAAFNNETINTISEAGYVVTFTTSTGGSIGTFSKIGDTIVIAGFTSTAAPYNGTWTLSAVLGPQKYQFIATTTGLPTNPSGGNASFGLFTLVTASAFTLTATQLVNVAGVTTSTYNAQYQVRSGGVAATTFFIYNGDLAGLTSGSSGNGTVSVGGSIVSGKHMVTVLFVTDQAYLTQLAPPSFWIAGGSRRALCANIPTGPANVRQRILCFSAVNADSFFYTGAGSPLYSGNMIINDNVTTTVAVDFTDALLLEGINVDDLFDLVELGECCAVTSYDQRLIWSGERNKLEQNAGGPNNFGFEGGFNLAGCPYGWTPDPTSFAGGAQGPFQYANFGASYGITGDGSTAVRGKISQTAVQDWGGDPIIQTNTSYSVRALISLDPANTPTTGTIHVVLSSASTSFSSGLALAANQLTTAFVEYSGLLTNPLTSIPSDLVFAVYVDGTPGNGKTFVIDSIEVYPTNMPDNVTIVRASRVPDEEGLYTAESYNGVDGFQDVGAADGFPVRCSFVRRDFLYHVKDRGIWVTAEDPNSEFANWNLQQVSATIGSPSARGIAHGDDFDVIAGINGAYLFENGQFGDQPLTTEIQPTWDQINWAKGFLLDARVDTKRKRVYIAAPLGANQAKNNVIFTLDYTQGWQDATNNNGVGRKWAIWNIPCNALNLIQRQNGIWQLFFGNNSNNGLITGLDLTGTVFTDNAVSQFAPNSGIKINDYWQGGYFSNTSRMDFGYLTANVVGSGMLQPILRKGDQSWVTQIRPWRMSALNFSDLERVLPAGLETYRLSVRFNSVGLNDHFSLQSMAFWVKESAYAATRGVNF